VLGEAGAVGAAVRGAMVGFDLFGPLVTEPGYPPLERAWQLLTDGVRGRGAHPETSRLYAEVAATAGRQVGSQSGAFSRCRLPTLTETGRCSLRQARRSPPLGWQLEPTST
jgi:hypothetical protein